jgi:hypothetical protein
MLQHSVSASDGRKERMKEWGSIEKSDTHRRMLQHSMSAIKGREKFYPPKRFSETRARTLLCSVLARI